MRIVLLFVGLVVLAILSLGFGRYSLSTVTVVQVLVGQVIDIPMTWEQADQR